MTAQLPPGERVRPVRDRPLRVASGPPSATVPVPACLSGLLIDDGDAVEAP